MILAAGRGERMRPLTDHIPKPLVEVAGVPLIEHHLGKLAAAGLKHVVINHAHLGEKIEQRLGDGRRFGLSIDYSPEHEGALETAGGIQQALPLLCKQRDSFLVINADVFTDYDFAVLLAHDPGNRLAHLVMVDTPAFKAGGDFVLDENGLLSENGNGRWLTFAGLSLMSRELFAGLQAGRAALRPLLVAAMQQQRVSAEYFSGNWEDVGTSERLDALNARFG
ncbi:MAG: nucleotidyltransferase family protein [Pseudomonadales bacterium]